jgi:hypothetical protein
MAGTQTRRQAPRTTPQPRQAPTDKAAASPRIALAVQGSFGHIVYAAGILDAFRAHNHAVPAAQRLEFPLASGCVEMLTPLWLFLNAPHGEISLRDAVVKDDYLTPWWVQSRIAPPAIRADALTSYLKGLGQASKRLSMAYQELLVRTFRVAGSRAAFHGDVDSIAGSALQTINELNAAWQDVATYSSGIPGNIAFNPFFMAWKSGDLEKCCADNHAGTVFTNATRADTLDEVYLYSGEAPDAAQLENLRGNRHQREVRRLTPEFFFASGARPPYIAPIPVETENGTEYWMEGAMRCNPPLNPLVDMGATHIVLLRFFCKHPAQEPNNNGELNERFLDALFNIPLQKEIEAIEFRNKLSGISLNHPELAAKSRSVSIIDPGDPDALESRKPCPAYLDFLSDNLGTLSHYDGLTSTRRAEMFDAGFGIGRQLVRYLNDQLGLRETTATAAESQSKTRGFQSKQVA